MKILFATSNKNKFVEAAEILKEFDINITHFQFDYSEIRSDNIEEIARDAVAEAYARCKAPVFVEDSGMFIDALDGFPGTFSGWVLRKIGVNGILKLMKGIKNRSATFKACIAYHGGQSITTFIGTCPGQIAENARGESGFGYDPIFIPHDAKQTFAESIELKNKLSHRYKSLIEFSKYLTLQKS